MIKYFSISLINFPHVFATAGHFLINFWKTNLKDNMIPLLNNQGKLEL